MKSTKIVYRIEGKKGIAEGYEFGPDIIYIRNPHFPLTRFSDWHLRTRKIDPYIESFIHSDFRLGQAVGLIIAQWDWRGSEPGLISRDTLKKLGQLRKDLRLDKSQRDLENELYLELKAEQKAERARAKRAASPQLELNMEPASNVVRLGDRS